jgi:hypothetical protein
MKRLPAAVAVAVGLAAAFEYATTGTVGTGTRVEQVTLAVAVVAALVANAMREGRWVLREPDTKAREKAKAPAQEVREHGTESRERT